MENRVTLLLLESGLVSEEIQLYPRSFLAVLLVVATTNVQTIYLLFQRSPPTPAEHSLEVGVNAEN